MSGAQVNKSTGQQVNRSHGATALDRDDCRGRFHGDLPTRSFDFACATLKLVDLLPSNTIGWTIGKQLLRSGTSIGANIAEADQALTNAEIIQRCSIARKEAAETRYWLRICGACDILPSEALADPLYAVDELLRILGTIIRRSHRKE